MVNPCYRKRLSCCNIIAFPLLLFFFASLPANASFTATTTESIQGRAPWMLFNGGTTEAKNLKELLSFTVPDGKGGTTTITPDITTAIKVPKGSTFADIKTKLSANNTAHDLKTLYQNGTITVKDADGDIFYSTDAVKGTFKATLVDKNNVAISNLNGELSPCFSPYKLTIAVNNVLVQSQYGNPKQNSYGDQTKSYILDIAPGICYAQPNLRNGAGQYAGPASVWNPTKGFLVQSTTNPALNFPTTGFDGAYFHLDVGGDLTVNNGESWTVTYYDAGNNVIANSGSDVEVIAQGDTNNTSGTDPIVGAGNKVKVLLTGPNALSAVNRRKFKPVTVKISPPAPNQDKLSYRFKLQRWFVPKSDYVSYPNAVQFCKNYGGGDGNGLTTGSYIVPSRKAYTNSPKAFVNDGSKGGDYTRTIGVESPSSANLAGGIFAEWGYTFGGYYKDNQWQSTFYWSSEAQSGNIQYYIFSGSGGVYYGIPNAVSRFACHSR